MPLVNKHGRITLLRINAVGSGYGPPSDFIDVEVVIKLDTNPNQSYGFQLRSNDEGPTRQAMFELLRDAFNGNRNVFLDVFLDPGRNNGIIHRVWITH